MSGSFDGADLGGGTDAALFDGGGADTDLSAGAAGSAGAASSRVVASVAAVAVLSSVSVASAVGA
ncbi:MAG: hypothetical protein KC657_15490, partial [Myxococcales bacterium]|nr:hypothetical protein [Myxococcales bacterium]